MPKYAHENFVFELSQEDSTKKWNSHNRTNYGSFAVEPKANKKKRRQSTFYVENEDGSRSASASVTRIVGDALVVTWTQENGYGIGYIDRSEEKKASARKEHRRQAAKIRKEQQLKSGVGTYNGTPTKVKPQVQRQTSAAA